MNCMRRPYWLGLVCLLLGCTSPESSEQPPVVFTGLDAEYVGDTACFDCHEDQWRGFQEHGMARSYYPLTPAVAVEDFAAAPVHHEGSGFYYRAYADGERFYQEEYRLDGAGNKVHALVREMHYVVGSGNAARTYLTESDGRLYEMPLTWYSQASTWDLSPGYQIYNKRFDRLVPDRCMACHNSYPSSVPYVTGKYEHVPEGIGCERCHGPGGRHIEERLASPGGDGADPTIVNPAHLSQDLQMDVCQQCHLHTTVSLLRAGRDPFDFRPSERLEDHVALFAAATDERDGIDVISHAQRLRQSACFVSAPMTCTTCHNPHEGFRDKGPAYFDDTCISCHAAPAETVHANGDSCIGCHMPKEAAIGAPHASFTDHWIRVVGTESPDSPTTTDALTPYYARDQGANDGAVYQAMAYLVHGTQQADTSYLNRGIALALPVHEGDSTGELSFLLGTALTNLGRADESVEPLRQAIERQSSPERLNALAQALEQSGDADPEVQALYDRALEQQPAAADIRINYGLFLMRQGRVRNGLVQFRHAADEEPWNALAHTHLGTALLQDGDFDGAEASLRRALALSPDGADALGNLGLLFSTIPERSGEARQLFERAVVADPQNAIAHANLGTWLVNNGYAAAAIGPLLQAVTLEPTFVGAMLNLALAYARTADYARARRYAEAVLEQDPRNGMALQILSAL